MMATAKRRRVNRSERVDPTPETVRHLQPDPLYWVLHNAWRHLGEDMDTANRRLAEDAADEIRSVYLAVLKEVMSKNATYNKHRIGGAYELTERLARIHAKRYIPWTQRNARNVVEGTITVVVDREPTLVEYPLIARALLDYARG